MRGSKSSRSPQTFLMVTRYYYFVESSHAMMTADSQIKLIELTAKDMSLNSPSTTAVPLKRGAGLPINVSLIFVVLIYEKPSQNLCQSKDE